MLTAVYFDNDTQLVTGKVRKIGTDGSLSPKMLILEGRLP
jgi:hypothetical protein